MTLTLNRDDIQGNVLLPYSRTRFPIGILLLLHLDRDRHRSTGGENTRQFLQELLPEITTAQLFASKRTRGQSPKASAPLADAPALLINVAFTAPGLAAVDVPEATLSGMPVEFLEGMKKRAPLLNDSVHTWDPIWQQNHADDQIDLAIMLRVNFDPCLDEAYRQHSEQRRHTKDYHPREVFATAREQALSRLDDAACRWIETGRNCGLHLLHWSGGASLPTAADQAAASLWLLTESLTRTRKQDGALAEPGNEHDLRYSEYEHFGFFDGSADPVFEGQLPPQDQAQAVIGQGRLDDGTWRPIATGEFLLGYGDEAQEMPAATMPFSFSRNGTFLVIRQLHQNVASFEQAINRQLPAFQRWLGADAQTANAEADRQLLRAKLVGRWEDGTPLVVAPSHGEWQTFRAEYRRRLDEAAHGDPAARQELLRFKQQFTDFRYESLDHDGGRCPITAHIRRSNPRDSGDPRLLDPSDDAARARAGSILVNRRRILRRGMTYGPPLASGCRQESSGQADSVAAGLSVDDGQERGVLFMALCTGITRQFEFLQQQWLNYGSEFGAGNDVCPISGVLAPQQPTQKSKLMIAAPDDSDRPPFVMRPASSPVECRGGDYFFLPSLTALRQIAQGLVDPL